MSQARKIVILPGDGIGPEIIAEGRKVLDAINEQYNLGLSMETCVFGGAAYDETGTPLPESTLNACRDSAAILLGAIGGPKYDKAPRELRPERGLLGLRSELGLFANLRPALLYPELAAASSLKPELVAGLDLMIVRELTGGIYFGQPRGIEERNGERVGFNTMVYSESEIRRIGIRAFEIARQRGSRLCSVDKMNVLEVSELWREIMIDVSKDYPDVELTHMFVDNAAMQLVRAPKQFDVMVTSNLFGDVLSDAAAMLTGSIGMLPSASLNEAGQGMYEPIHGSAPDIAGKGIANPLATILSVSMMLRYTLKEAEAADAIDAAVAQVLAQGYRCQDIATGQSEEKVINTTEMGDAVIAALQVGVDA
ncbi:3-isopropylmalate dehydrogenase [Granulosicoccus antarcticus]|uniref:3-isopropylmalate dehydrogenase n=1 Tax=Granulosicoccus antarcticus IMCC3135 TaxID=1192854 RepID=A0A2Z2NZX4_9GAMM|nr:3-isopropylmalate dehydrogenase [Granulosicoccus antarcticus]ASJ75338.1 3-isopropylmalate dehydrogenase [Granulosicoccus antarcticus IMCC3135]